MSKMEVVQIVLFLGVLVALTPVWGDFMARVFAGESHPLRCVLGPLEKGAYRLMGVSPDTEMTWKSYASALLMFNFLGLLVVFLLQVMQGALPLNPQGLPGVPWHLALNTAISFMTNTNWQSYAGETTLSDLTQMAGLTVQNFVSAATGIAVLLAMARGLNRKQSDHIGNFWADLTRGVIYIFLPISVLVAIFLVSQGVVQTFSPYEALKTLEGKDQLVGLGPAASQVAIKQLGSNGGGFFNANSAFPLENPTALTNFLQMFLLLGLAAALTRTYGRIVGQTRQGAVLFWAMLFMFVGGLGLSLYSEFSGNALFGGVIPMEGKEVRLGHANSVLWSVATTAASNGSINALHSSLSPLSGLVTLLNIQVGEVIFGGVGAGLYGMLMFVVLSVFIAGLMVGRTPEYLGKKVEAAEVKMAVLAILLPSACILLFTALAAVLPVGLSSRAHTGPHGLSEMLYAYSSAAGNNGSAFAGLNANTVFYNLTLGFSMLVGRFGVIIPALAIAGSMARKKTSPPSSGTFPTDGPLFAVLLVGVVMLVGALTFLPVLSLGPIVEHLFLIQGRSF